MDGHKLFLLVVVILLNGVASQIAATYTVDSYPNPQHYESFHACANHQREYVCDPEEVLNATERAQLAQLLKELQNQTQNPSATSECKRKGISLAIALSKQPIAGTVTKAAFSYRTEEHAMTSGEVAEALLANWRIEEDCRKAMLIVMPIEKPEETVEYHYKQVPLVPADVEHILHREMSLIQHGKILLALTEILNSTRRLVAAKQSLLSDDVPVSSIVPSVSTTPKPPASVLPTSFDTPSPAPTTASTSPRLASTTLVAECTTTDLLWSQFLANLLSWLVIVCVLLGIYVICKNLRMHNLLKVFRNVDSASRKNCDQHVYMTQVSDCEEG